MRPSPRFVSIPKSCVQIPHTHNTNYKHTFNMGWNCSESARMPDTDKLGLPPGFNLAVLPRNNQSEAVLESCCDPNPIKTVHDCYLWCELSDDKFDHPDKAKYKEVINVVRQCVQNFDGPTDMIRAQGAVAANPAPKTVSSAGVLLFGLMVSAFFVHSV